MTEQEQVYTIEELVAMEELTEQEGKDLEDAIQVRSDIAVSEKGLKEHKETVNGVIRKSLKCKGLSAFAVDGIGKIRITDSARETIKKDRLKIALLKAGLPADKIEEILAEATVTSDFTSVRFTAEKEK